ncbi:MAG: hypothetical protein HYU99_09575 [Deltaproteobacteria bacterium]|nr:hypothetical protein [Deltaproteobacteria bacterium]
MMFIWPLLLASDSGLWPEDPSTEIAATPSSLLSADPNDNYKASLALGGAVAVRQSVQTVTRLATPTALESASVTWGTEAAILEGGATAAGGAEIVAGEGLLMGALRLATTLVRFSPLALIFMESDRPSREKPVEPAPEVYRTDIEAVGVPDYEAWKKWSEMEKHRRAIRWIEADGKRLKQSDGWIRWQIEKYLEENGLTLEDLDAFENPVESYAFKASSASGNNPAAEIDTTESPFLDAAGLQERILKAKGEGKRVVVEIGCGAEANHLRLLAEKNPDIVYFGIDPDPKIEEADSQSLPKNIFLHRGNAWPALQGLENQQAIDELLFVAPEGSDDFNRRRAEHNADLASWFHEPIPRMTFRNKELPLYYNLLAPGGKITIYTEVLEWAMDYCNRLSPVADRMETALYTDDAVFPEMSPRTELVTNGEV